MRGTRDMLDVLLLKRIGEWGRCINIMGILLNTLLRTEQDCRVSMFAVTTVKRGYMIKSKGFLTTTLFSLFWEMACNGSEYETTK